MTDSPAGLLGWNAQLFAEDVDDEFILGNVAVYWFTRTAASAMRLYLEQDKADQPAVPPSDVPIGLGQFGTDFKSIRRFADGTTARSCPGTSTRRAATTRHTRCPRCSPPMSGSSSRRCADRYRSLSVLRSAALALRAMSCTASRRCRSASYSSRRSFTVRAGMPTAMP